MDVAVEVRTAVNEAKKQVKTCQTAQELSDTILQFVHLVDKNTSSNCSSQDFPPFCGIRYSADFKKVFISQHYSNLCEHIFVYSDPNFLKDKNFVTILTRLFLEGPADFSLLALVSSISSITHTDKLHAIVSILDDFASSGKFTELFLSQCLVNPSKNLAKELLTVLTSLPDILSNKMKLALNGKFHPNIYYETITKEIIETLTKVHEIAFQLKDYTTSFLSSLIGKIALRGSTGTMFNVLLPQLKKWCYTSPLWSNICSKLLTEVPEMSLEQVIEYLLKNISFYPFFCKILKDSMLSNAFIKHLLTHKFLLVRHYNEPNVLQNIVGYLCGDSRRDVLIDVLKTLLSHWQNANSIKHTSYEQHFYITQAIILAIVQLNATEITEHKNDLLHKMLSGVQTHLENPNSKIRQLGMITAECMTACLHPDGQRLKFEIKEDGDVAKLRALAAAPKFNSDVEKGNFLNESVVVDTELTNHEIKDLKGSHKEKATLDDHDEGDEDDLQPFEMSEGDDNLIEGIHPPRYISQCIDGLLASDDPKQHIASLHVLKHVIENDGNNLPHQCVQLVTILLHLQDKYSLEDYDKLRFSAMVGTMIRCPVPVADYLTKEFYAQNYNLRQRMDILDVIAATATQLSKPDSSKDGSASSVKISEVDGSHETNNWKAVVQERIDKKTRKFSKKSSVVQAKVTVNRFANVAGHFFFPLLHGFDNCENTFDLLGEDCMVLGSLVCTLGNIMYFARGTLVAQNMGKSLLDFVWVLRYHSDGHVRQGLLFALAMVVVSVPGFFLMTVVQDELAECQSWLEYVLYNDPNTQCRELALQVLVSIRDVFQKQFTTD